MNETPNPSDSTDARLQGAAGDGASDPVRLEVFSDYTCPWCYIGWARLERALDGLPDGVRVEVEWKPFEIHPDVPADGMPVEDLGYPADVWERMQVALTEAAAEEGLELANRPKVSNTHRALVAGSWVKARQPDRFPAFHESLFRGYFSRGMDLGDPDVIRTLAGESGVDVDAMDAALAAGASEDELAATSQLARGWGITATPTFVFDRRVMAAGAQPAGVLKDAIERMVAEGTGGSPS